MSDPYEETIRSLFKEFPPEKDDDYPLLNEQPYPTEFQQTKQSKRNSLRFLRSNIIEVKATCKGEELCFVTDAENVDLIKEYTWYISKKDEKMYVMTNVKNKKMFFHHFIRDFKTVEHRNGCNLDNRIENLVERGKTQKLTHLDIKRALRLTTFENGDCMVEFPNGNNIQEEMFYVDVYKSKKKTLNEAQKYKKEKWKHMLTMDKGLYYSATYDDVIFNITHPEEFEKSHPVIFFMKKTQGPIKEHPLRLAPYHRYNGRYKPLKKTPDVHKTQDGKHYKATIRLREGEKEVKLIAIENYISEDEAKSAAQQWIIQRKQELGMYLNMYRRLHKDILQIQALCDSEMLSFIIDFSVLSKIKKKRWFIKNIDGRHYAYYINRNKEHVYFHSLFVEYERVVHINGELFT